MNVRALAELSRRIEVLQDMNPPMDSYGHGVLTGLMEARELFEEELKSAW